MGNGRRAGNKLNFQITANYDMQPADYTRWRRAFKKASEILYNATEGQISYGNIYVTKNSVGIGNAEIVLDEEINGRALATLGGFGEADKAITMLRYAQTQVQTINHEMGHHVWSLDEEYSGNIRLAIDAAYVLPADHGNKIIPLVEAGAEFPDEDFANFNAILKFNGLSETQAIERKEGNLIYVEAAFSSNPQNNEFTGNRVTVEWEAECTDDVSTGACIMQFSRDSAGTLQGDGTWEPADEPVTEFCTEANQRP